MQFQSQEGRRFGIINETAEKYLGIGNSARRPQAFVVIRVESIQHKVRETGQSCMMARVGGTLPLSALLSNVLVAFTIEFDNEFEHQVPHRTTRDKAKRGAAELPWLVSMAMWSKYLRLVPEEGISVRELQRLTQEKPQELRAWLTRLAKWWGYITVGAVGPDTVATRAKQRGAKGRSSAPDWMVRPTAGGQKAIAVWRPLTGAIEKRWDERFGADKVRELRSSLRKLIERFDAEPPDSLPILGYGLFSNAGLPRERWPKGRTNSSTLTDMLPALVSKALLAFAVEFESQSEVSLGISANILQVMGEEGQPLADVPRLAGVSKEAVATAASFLEKRGYAKAQRASRGRGKALMLTAKGRRAKETYERLTREIEARWATTFGNATVAAVRSALERLVNEDDGGASPLFAGLEPYADGWRAAIPRPKVLPHYPMILHRGGFPDGS